MLPYVIEKILTLTDADGSPVAFQNMTQIIIDPFPALMTFNLRIAPTPAARVPQLVYEIGFGQAMMPHAFDTKIYQGGSKILDAIISGRYTGRSLDCFVFLDSGHPLTITPTNRRILDNYFEVALFYLDIADEFAFKLIKDMVKKWSEIVEEPLTEDFTPPRAISRGGGVV